MSEAAGASSATPNAGAGAGASQSGQSQANSAGNGPAKAAQNQGGAGKAAARDAAQGAAGSQGSPGAGAEVTPEELEEIKLGGLTGKLPKALAKAVKDLERGFHTHAQANAAYRQVLGDVHPSQLAQAAKNDPRAQEYILQRFGIDADQFSQARLARMLQDQMMTPEQKRLRDLEQENRQYKETEAQRKERERQEKEQADYQKEATRVRAEAGKAISQSEIIKNDNYLASRVFAIKGAFEDAGHELTWEEAVSKVESEFIQAMKRRASSLKPEQLEEMIGGDGLKGWREFDLARVTQKASAKSASKDSRPGDSPASQRKNKGPMSENEYREYYDRLTRGE